MSSDAVSEPSKSSSDPVLGLGREAARAKLSEVGLNELLIVKQRPLLLQWLAYFAQPLTAILLIAAIVSEFRATG